MTFPSPRRVIAYLDCFSGISGDMLLGALVNAGLPLETLIATLQQLDLDDFRIIARSGAPSPIQGTRVQVLVTGHPPQRDWQAILALLQASRLTAAVKARALSIFTVLAEAEAKVHGCPVEEVHFHEVGAVDSIVDIVGAAIGLDYLAIDEVVSSPLPMATGWVRTGHGPLPLPAPAVCEILKGVPVFGLELRPAPFAQEGTSVHSPSVVDGVSDRDRGMELVTPTGAAIVKACARGFGPLPAMTINRVGYGGGSKERPDGRPNLLRVIIGEGRTVTEAQQVTIIETNLDDWSPETFPFLSERLFAEGALDVTLIPIHMKKGRPGFTIQVVAPPLAALGLQQLLLTETSAIGLRFRDEARRTLPRRLGSIPTRLGLVRAKLVETPAGLRVTPEYEACRRLAMATGTPITEIYRAVAIQPPELFQPDRPEEGADPHAG